MIQTVGVAVGMAVDVNSSLLTENRVINVPVGRVLCSRKWMNSDLVTTMKGYVTDTLLKNLRNKRALISQYNDSYSQKFHITALPCEKTPI